MMRRAWTIIFCFILGGLAQGQDPIEFEVAAELPMEFPPGNIAVTDYGRIIVSMHQFYEPQLRVGELVFEDGGTTVSVKPFPNAEANGEGTADGLKLDTVLGLQCDQRGVVWMLDNGMRGGSLPKLISWVASKDRIGRVIYIPPPATVEGSFLNDLAVDMKRAMCYIADPVAGGKDALIVVNLRSGLSRRVLQGHPSVVPDDADMVIEDRPLEISRPNGSTVRPRIGVNPIVLDAQSEWVYYGPMTGGSLYRIPAEALADPALDDAALAQKIERYADKPHCDGISIDSADNIYISEIEANAVGVIAPDRSYRRLFQDEQLSWPDAFSYGPRRYMYVVAAQLHRSKVLAGGVDRTEMPFRILRFRPLAPGILGR